MIPIYEMTAQAWDSLPKETKAQYPDIDGCIYAGVHTNYWMFGVSNALRAGIPVPETTFEGLTQDENFGLFWMAGLT